MKLWTPKIKRNVQRIIPFGVIWLIMGFVFLTVESAAVGTLTPNDEEAINLTPSVLVFAFTGITIVGLIIGTIEILLLENLFKYQSFSAKIFYKFIIYAFFLFLFIGLTYPIAASLEMGVSYFSSEVWARYFDFLGSLVFISTAFQLSLEVLVSLVYSNISENLGHNVMINYLRGSYHRPKQEIRIFMFLDMKSSTTIAEKLGNVKYFELLREYYSSLSNAIINNSGEVYQYIGDEIVISWKKKQGIRNSNCLNCFFEMREDLKRKEEYFNNKFGVAPSFKAGMHLGEVTTGEIGALKKEIVFTGDVLNTTARIQSLCNENQTDLLISAKLTELLSIQDSKQFRDLGVVELKGKSEPVKLFALTRTRQIDFTNQ